MEKPRRRGEKKKKCRKLRRRKDWKEREELEMRNRKEKGLHAKKIKTDKNGGIKLKGRKGNGGER